MNKKIIMLVVTIIFLAGCSQKPVDKNNQQAQILQPSENAVSYDCQGKEIKVDFNNNVDPTTATIYIMDSNKQMTLPTVRTGSGARYSNGETTFWTHQGDATLTTENDKSTLHCTENSSPKTQNNIMDENGNTVPEGCKVWFDGCNTCHVNTNGIMACTRKLCNTNTLQQAHCVDDK